MKRRPHPKELFALEPFWSKSIWVYSPNEVLRMAIENEQWIAGIVLSTMYFEHFGIEKLKEKFRGRIEPERIENLHLEAVIMFLLASGIIDENTYSKMLEISKERNKIVHRITGIVDLEPEEAEKLIKKAIKCLVALGHLPPKPK